MPASLLDSQLATLEMPSAAEHAIVVDGTLDPEVQVSRVIAALQDSSRA
jgi:gluconate kinase